MIDYVDRVLKHWAQEMSVYHSGVNLGFKSGWMDGALMEGGAPRSRGLTARGTATRGGQVKRDLGRVAERVNQSVDRLPKEFKEVIELHYLERPGDSVARKSESLGCSRKTYYKDIHRAQDLLKSDLPDAYVNFGASYPHCG